ncbi:protein DOWN-REGULATED IN DIF1 11-like [Fagus crenata]
MARINSFSVVVAMFLALGLVVLSPGLASRVILESESEAPGYYDHDTDFAPVEAFDNDDFPPETLPNDPNADFLEACARKLTGDCGESIFTNIFANDSTLINDHCCHLLVAMGQECHNKLVNNIIDKIPEYKTNETITRPRSVKIWNKCALVADTVSPASSPSEN